MLLWHCCATGIAHRDQMVPNGRGGGWGVEVGVGVEGGGWGVGGGRGVGRWVGVECGDGWGEVGAGERGGCRVVCHPLTRCWHQCHQTEFHIFVVYTMCSFECKRY